MTENNNLPSLKRFITTHDSTTGKAIFSDALSEENTFRPIPGAGFALGYTTKEFPPDLNNDSDISIYKSFLETPPGIVISGGTVLRFVDMAPDHLSPMHRTVSLDYGIVIEGEVDLVLDSGEVRSMKRGDTAIQRGTMHAWRTPSKTEWSRMVFILQDSKPLFVNGKELGDDYGGLEVQSVKDYTSKSK